MADIHIGKRDISRSDRSLQMPIVRAATDCRIYLRMTTIVGACTWPALSRALMQRVLSVKTEAGWRSCETTVLPWIYIGHTNPDYSSQKTSFFGDVGLNRFWKIDTHTMLFETAFLFEVIAINLVWELRRVTINSRKTIVRLCKLIT